MDQPVGKRMHLPRYAIALLQNDLLVLWDGGEK